MKNKNDGTLTSNQGESSASVSSRRDTSCLLPLCNRPLAPASRALFTTVIAGMTAISQGQAQQPAAPSRGATQPNAQAAPARVLTYDELERLYLDGKMSAKQYEKA